MAHGLNSVLKRGVTTVQGCKSEGKTGIGSRRIFAPHFKLQVLDSYRSDADCKGNQRATARKYGIHRRQIQKWLQVENTLRCSVNKSVKSVDSNIENPEARKCGIEMALSKNGGHGGRLRDDLCADTTTYSQSNISGAVSCGLEARVPALSPAIYSTAPADGGYVWPDSTTAPIPLDFTTHSRGYVSPIMISSPECMSPVDPATPMDLSLKRPTSLLMTAGSKPSAPVPLLYAAAAAPSPPSLVQPHPDVWDLSTKRKCDRTARSPSHTSSKPVKLFKPYLDDDDEVKREVKTEAPHPVKLEAASPPCCIPLSHPHCDAYYYNNNNNVCEIKSEYASPPYTLHELQPKTTPTYYYTFPNVYPSPAEYEVNVYCGAYEDGGYMQGDVAPLKQRQSYSLDFKLSAIDCYYQDSVCKGNQRAVASKYNIHRRQVQKWLKQAEELRQKNESMKQIHAVR